MYTERVFESHWMFFLSVIFFLFVIFTKTFTFEIYFIVQLPDNVFTPYAIYIAQNISHKSILFHTEREHIQELKQRYRHIKHKGMLVATPERNLFHVYMYWCWLNILKGLLKDIGHSNTLNARGWGTGLVCTFFFFASHQSRGAPLSTYYSKAPIYLY